MPMVPITGALLVNKPTDTQTQTHTHTHTHTQPFNCLWSGTTRVGQYQKKLSPILIIEHQSQTNPQNVGILRYSRWHMWSLTTCFGVTNHSKVALLWLVRQKQANNNSGSLPSCDCHFWKWLTVTQSAAAVTGRCASRYLSSRYLSYLCLWHQSMHDFLSALHSICVEPLSSCKP